MLGFLTQNNVSTVCECSENLKKESKKKLNCPNQYNNTVGLLNLGNLGINGASFQLLQFITHNLKQQSLKSGEKQKEAWSQAHISFMQLKCTRHLSCFSWL